MSSDKYKMCSDKTLFVHCSDKKAKNIINHVINSPKKQPYRDSKISRQKW